MSRDVPITALLACISGVLLVPILIETNALPFRITTLRALSIIVALVTLELSGLALARLLARMFPFFNNLARFVVTGIFNTVFDTSVLLFLAYALNVYAGFWLALCNVLSFSSTTVVSYFINRRWSFATEGRASTREFAGFMSVGVSSMLLNTVLVYFLTTHVTPPFAATPAQWVTIAKASGVLISFLWNFVWFQLVIFRKRAAISSAQPQ